MLYIPLIYVGSFEAWEIAYKYVEPPERFDYKGSAFEKPHRRGPLSNPHPRFHNYIASFNVSRYPLPDMRPNTCSSWEGNGSDTNDRSLPVSRSDLPSSLSKSSNEIETPWERPLSESISNSALVLNTIGVRMADELQPALEGAIPRLIRIKIAVGTIPCEWHEIQTYLFI